MAAPRSEPKRVGARVSRGGTTGSKRRPPDQARSSVLAAADRLFYEHGLRGVGVDTIAEAAGVTKRTLYYHFATKEALIAAYLEARDDAVRLAIERTVQPGTLPGDRILAVFDHLQQWFASPAYRGCPFNNAVAEDAGGAAAEIVRRHKAVLRLWLAEQAELAGARGAKELGAELLLLIDGALNGALVFGSDEPARVARRVAAALLEQAGAALSKPKAKSRAGKSSSSR
jgi:AcrR family transcriptional regulator